MDRETKGLKVGLFTKDSGTIYRPFIHRHYAQLKQENIHIEWVVLDRYQDKKDHFFKHALRVAKRQAKYNGFPWFLQIVNILFYKAMVRSKQHPANQHPLPEEIVTVEVGNLNDDVCVETTKQLPCDVICLMGTRIISKKVLDALKPALVINIHSGDPAFVRGSPALFWEILDGRDTIVLTIHEVVPELDAGPILLQKELPIRYSGSLGKTLDATSDLLPDQITDMFKEVLRQCQNKTEERRPFSPGKIRVIPSVLQTIAAHRVCQKKTASGQKSV
ncbi:MAG: hypothetical protein HQL72_05400 [Magnetococcales bacterium]|nr:hypothetical protein [Magnetococcales bacterium]